VIKLEFSHSVANRGTPNIASASLEFYAEKRLFHVFILANKINLGLGALSPIRIIRPEFWWISEFKLEVGKLWLDFLMPPLNNVLIRYDAPAYRLDHAIAYPAKIPLPEPNTVKATVAMQTISPDGRPYVFRRLVAESIGLEVRRTIITQKQGLDAGISPGLTMAGTGVRGKRIRG
jgi:hypothetical protein